MQKPLEITFHGLDRSDAVEARIREKFERIEARFDRISHARIVVEAPQRRSPVPKFFHISIDIAVPGHKPIIVQYQPEAAVAHTDVMLALRDAFASAQRQVDELANRMEKSARHERVRRRPATNGSGGQT